MSLASDHPDPLHAWLAATQTDDRRTPQPAAAGEEPTEPASAGHGVSRRLLRATAVTCVLALGLGIASWRPQEAVAPITPTPRVQAVAATPVPTEPALPVPGPDSAVAGTPMPMAQAAAAVTAVRLGVPPDRYVDTAAVESVHPAGTASIVIVRAVVLDQLGQEWANPHTARYAVAVSTHEPVAVTAPWALPPEESAPLRLSWQPAPTLRAAASTALEAAGYRSISDVRVRRSDTLPDVVSALCRATAPGDSTSRRHEVWLGADAAHVLGVTNASPPIPVPAEQP
jgi:hypothetical protein